MTGYPHQVHGKRAGSRDGIWRRVEDPLPCECGKVARYRYGVELAGKVIVGLPPIQWDAAMVLLAPLPRGMGRRR